MEANQAEKRLASILEDDGVFDAIIAILDAHRDSAAAKLSSRPKGGFYDVAAQSMFDRGVCVSVDELKMKLTNLKNMATN